MILSVWLLVHSTAAFHITTSPWIIPASSTKLFSKVVPCDETIVFSEIVPDDNEKSAEIKQATADDDDDDDEYSRERLRDTFRRKGVDENDLDDYVATLRP